MLLKEGRVSKLVRYVRTVHRFFGKKVGGIWDGGSDMIH